MLADAEKQQYALLRRAGAISLGLYASPRAWVVARTTGPVSGHFNTDKLMHTSPR